MATGTVTSKGQTTIPKEIRDGLGLRPKDQIHYTLLSDDTVIMRAKKRNIAELYARCIGLAGARFRLQS